MTDGVAMIRALCIGYCLARTTRMIPTLAAEAVVQNEAIFAANRVRSSNIASGGHRMPHGSPLTHRVRRRFLPRDLARRPARGHLLWRRRSPGLDRDPGRGVRAIQLAQSRLLPDDQPLHVVVETVDGNSPRARANSTASTRSTSIARTDGLATYSRGATRRSWSRRTPTCWNWCAMSC